MKKIAIAVLTAVALRAAPAKALQVETISVDSAWGGLGKPAHSTLLIHREDDHYLSDGKVISKERVTALLAAVGQPTLPAPNPDNLGLSKKWLQEHEEQAGDYATYIDYKAGTKQQKELFISAFTDEKTLQQRLDSLYRSFHTDDYPHITVNVRFVDGSGFEIRSNSQHPFMIPWELKRNAAVTKTYMGHISEALVALLPPGFTNRDALTSGDQYADGLIAELAADTGTAVKGEWESLGAQSQAGAALDTLKATYAVRRSDVNSFHNLDFGKEWTGGRPQEENLEVDLWRPGFPRNSVVGAFLLRQHGITEGAENVALKSEAYERLVLSIDWLREFWNTHPEDHAMMFYVHGVSLTEKGMKTFAADMKVAGRQDLVQKVKSVQAQAVLIETSNLGSALEYGRGDYWIVLPDKTVILRRWQSLNHVLRWKPAVFPAH